MKTTFTIPSTSLGTMKKYEKLISKMSDITNRQIFVVTDKKLSVYVTGKQSVLNFSVDIDGFSSDKEEDFIALAYDKFVTTADRIAREGEALSVTIEDEGLKLLLKSTTTKSKVTLSCFNVATEQEVEDVKEAYSSLHTEYFSSGVKKISITKGMMDFAKVSSRFMKLTLKSNAVQVEKNLVKYADNTSIITYVDKEQLLDSADGDHVAVHTLVLDLVDATGSPDRVVSYSSNGLFASFQSVSLDALRFIINVPPVQFDFPSNEEEALFAPDPSQSIKITVNRDIFLSALYLFNGIFDTSLWKWKSLKFLYQSSTPGAIQLSHSDSNAEAERDCEILSIEDNIGVDEASFTFSSEFYQNVLEFGQGIFKANLDKNNPIDDTLTIEFSNKGLDEEHGMGVVVSSADGQLRAVFAKFQD